MPFPALNVQIGFLATTAGDPYLTFNDATLGKFNTGQFAPDYVWANVTTDLRTATTNRGRQRQVEAYPAGTLTLTLDNNAGNYDPDNTASIYYQSGATTVLPMRPIKLTAEWNGTDYPIFYGYIDQIVPDYAPGRYSDAWVTITASDGMKVLQNIPSGGGAAPSELTGARIGRALDAVSWPAALRDIAAGDVMLRATTLTATAAQDIQTAVDSEYGRWYMSADGKVTFEGRSSRNTVQTAQATWTDTSTTGLLYSELGRVMDDDLLRNTVSIQNVSGTAQVLTDATSITQYQERSYSASNLLLTTDAEALQLANIILYNGKVLSGTRLESVDFQPLTAIAAGAAGDLWPEMLGRQISDRVGVVVTPPHGTPFTIGAYVEGVGHTITAQPVQGWTTTFSASRQSPTRFLQFNDATFGTIGTTNTLSF